MAEHSELSQFVIDLEQGNDAFDLLPENDLADGNRYDPCDMCIEMQEELLITSNYSCGQIICNHDKIDFNLDSATTNDLVPESDKEQKTIDLTKSPVKRQQKMTELLQPPMSMLDITETPSPATMIRNPKRRLDLCGTSLSLVSNIKSSSSKKAKLSPQPHTPESALKNIGFHTHYCVGLDKSPEPR